jgi:transcriptional regulator with XRE-family HTH domain
MREFGWTATDLASRLGLSYAYASGLLRGARPMEIYALEISRALCLNANQLLSPEELERRLAAEKMSQRHTQEAMLPDVDDEPEMAYSSASASCRPMRCSPPLPMPTAEETKTFVYFVRDDECVKIGHATDLAKRLRTLQIGNPRPLVLEASVRGGRTLELALHQRLSVHRLDRRTEWFLLSPRQVQEVLRSVPRVEVDELRPFFDLGPVTLFPKESGP